jgi:hypothetical protein
LHTATINQRSLQTTSDYEKASEKNITKKCVEQIHSLTASKLKIGFTNIRGVNLKRNCNIKLSSKPSQPRCHHGRKEKTNASQYAR